MNSYEEYLRAWTRGWALKISHRAGIEPGKGGRGKGEDPDRRLAQKLGVSYISWSQYKSGTHAPNSSFFKVIHERAITLGLLGQGETIEAAHERLCPMSRHQWLEGLSLAELAEIEMSVLRWKANPKALENATAALVACIHNSTQEVALRNGIT